MRCGVWSVRAGFGGWMDGWMDLPGRIWMIRDRGGEMDCLVG